MQRVRNNRKSPLVTPSRCFGCGVAQAATTVVVAFSSVLLQAAIEDADASSLSKNRTLLAEALATEEIPWPSESGGIDICKTYGHGISALPNAEELIKLCGNTPREKMKLTRAVKTCLDEGRKQNKLQLSAAGLNAVAGYCGNSYAYRAFGSEYAVPMSCGKKPLVDVIEPLALADCLRDIGTSSSNGVEDFMSCAESVSSSPFPATESMAGIRRKMGRKWPAGLPNNLVNLPSAVQEEIWKWSFYKLTGHKKWPDTTLKQVDICDPTLGVPSADVTDFRLGLCRKDKLNNHLLREAIKFCRDRHPTWKEAPIDFATIIGRYCAHDLAYTEILIKEFRNITCNSHPVSVRFARLPSDLREACLNLSDEAGPLAALEGTLLKSPSLSEKDRQHKERRVQRVTTALHTVNQSLGYAIAPGGKEAVERLQFWVNKGYQPRTKKHKYIDVCRSRVKEFPSPEITTRRLRLCAVDDPVMQEKLLRTLSNCALGESFRNRGEIIQTMKEALGRYCADAYTYKLLGQTKNVPRCDGMELRTTVLPGVINECLIDACSKPDPNVYPHAEDFLVCAAVNHREMSELNDDLNIGSEHAWLMNRMEQELVRKPSGMDANATTHWIESVAARYQPWKFDVYSYFANVNGTTTTKSPDFSQHNLLTNQKQVAGEHGDIGSGGMFAGVLSVCGVAGLAAIGALLYRFRARGAEPKYKLGNLAPEGEQDDV